jgi:hypothetical protein
VIGFLDCTSGGAVVPGGAEVVDIQAVLAGNAVGPLVVYAPAPGWSGESALAAALGRVERVILVRAERWDGHTPDPLAAAATGVISGFGEVGIAAAIAELLGD